MRMYIGVIENINEGSEHVVGVSENDEVVRERGLADMRNILASTFGEIDPGPTLEIRRLPSYDENWGGEIWGIVLTSMTESNMQPAVVFNIQSVEYLPFP